MPQGTAILSTSLHFPSDRGGDIVLDIDQLSKNFHSNGRVVQALNNVSFRVQHGKVTGLIGPDSAGKTTLMRLAAGLLVPDSGSIKVLGKNAATQSLQVQGSIGYMPQRFGLYEDLTVQENLDLYADLQGVPVIHRADRYQELLQMAGLEPFTGRLAGQLSGGMKQKLGLACSLVRQPALLLLDEPTVGVDPLSRRELWAIVNRLVRNEFTTVLLSTAYLDEAERCDEIFLLYDGQLLDQGDPKALRDRMQGRTWSVTAESLFKRSLQAHLSHAPGVVDALVQGEHVRLVMEDTTPPDLEAILPGMQNVSVAKVAPRYEDSFIALLKGQPHPDGATLPQATPPQALSSAKTADGGAIIEVDQLERRFGSFRAVKNVNFAVTRGEVFGLLGANGAGKTTTFRMLCGLLPPSAGNLRVAGVDLRNAPAAARAHIGYMSQKFSLYGHLSVIENLRFFSSAYGLSRKRAEQRMQWAMTEFALAPLANTVSGDLSLGYKQRLALACALMHEPDILFLDEPTSGVDPLARREFWQRIDTLAEQGVTIMVTTHFMEEAEYCDRLAIMVSGEILTIGTPTAIKLQARTEAVPDPTMEDAFIGLIEAQTQANSQMVPSA
ncbi:putative transporter fused subunits of ABC superfamily: ATP-binding components [Georgfuchsia toluolica]|uniref:Transporter fused subunits of ABC superfamily: ATP-binding components n=1 Tax=Georgfuchsia toluolica TaxID=424218 RepID=A0A916J569_9PROT|nr:ATP-binding cassette domain-containing protein [Georgfuchsia toluolica]CAG4882662.1 putative transporter fused subunits of ABC superfamily: ATP-binding components [Georgfuchsia toluolica]